MSGVPYVRCALCQVCPYARCELGRHLAAQPEGRMAEAEARGAARQLASAVAHFHHMGVAHMDLKPENVLRQRDGEHTRSTREYTVVRKCIVSRRCGATVSTEKVHAPQRLRPWPMRLQPLTHAVAGVLRLIDYGGAETFFRGDGLDEAWVDDHGGTENYRAPERLQASNYK
jgi:serine/threonine protein kinase